MKVKLGGLGVWSAELRSADPQEVISAAAEVESLGYSALWIPDVGGPLLEDLDRLLRATRSITVATGILSVWNHTPAEVAGWWHALPEEHRGRILLGLGVSHARVIGDTWGRPLATMTAYLDGLETQGMPLNRVCLAALGPKMLELAKDRTAGAHPYFVTPQHTSIARAALGDGLLAVEQGVVLGGDASQRALGRAVLKGYGSLPNYANNWRRLGYSESDIAEGSDQLLDALLVVGDEPAIEARIQEHQRAGADHVCIQVLTRPGEPLPLEAWRRLAPR